VNDSGFFWPLGQKFCESAPETPCPYAWRIHGA
jgi:hypothetical protein